MKKFYNISKTLSLDDVKRAATESFIGHNKDKNVILFKKNYEDNCNLLYNKLLDGTWKEILAYRQLVKINSNGKVRNIDSPSLETRIYQHLLMNFINPIYESKDNYNGLNCKKGCGITSKDKRKSVVHKLKHVFYDRTDLKYYLVIDQRKCYDHVTVKVFRNILKRMISDKWLIDFAIDVCFINKKLPIGTPTSPLVHNIIMMVFDHFSKEISQFSVRYADDNFLAFYNKEDANSAKWRIKNFWWYELGIRSNRKVKVRPFECPCDFCGYVLFRNSNKTKLDHNKGYTKLRERTANVAKRCNNNKSWSSYFGMMRHADAFSLMLKIEKDMKLRDLTSTIRISRNMDARNIDIRQLLNKVITVYNYETRLNNHNELNWIKCLIGMEEEVDGEKTGRILAYEFHGNYKGIIDFIAECEKAYGKENLLPLEDVEIENQCGFIFKGSTNQIRYIQ